MGQSAIQATTGASTCISRGNSHSRGAWMMLKPLEKSMNMILTVPLQVGVCTDDSVILPIVGLMYELEGL